MHTFEEQKKIACRAALSHVTPQTLLGVGSGSTVDIFLKLLAQSTQKPVHPLVCGSRFSEKTARSLGFSIASSDFFHLDVVVDGADHILEGNCFIKGGGGALFREKILATAAEKWIVVADESKKKPVKEVVVPIEVSPFGFSSTCRHLKHLEIEGEVRKEGNTPFLTDQSNWILDVRLPFSSLKNLEAKIFSIAGVIDWGFFHNFSPIVYIGKSDGTLQRSSYE